MKLPQLLSGLEATKRRDGSVDAAKLDRLMVQVRDTGGLDAAEKAAILQAADGFDDAGKQRLLQHLSKLGQSNAWVNLESAGRVTSVVGRYAQLEVGVPGLRAQLGLFDSTFGLKGAAKADGTISLVLEGQPISIEVKQGEAAATILLRLQAALPSHVTGLVFGGDVQPWDPEDFAGAPPKFGAQSAHLTLFKPNALGLRPGEVPLRVLVTGYGEFMGITDNTSADMAQQLASLGAPGAIVEYRRLDVTHAAVDAFVAELKRNPPDVVLSMGVSSQSQVEERPENRVGGGVDGKNQPIRPGAVRPGAAAELRTDLPVAAIDSALSIFGDVREVGTSQSDATYSPDRSAYLCNYLGFNLANTFGATPSTTAGFVHVTDHTPVEQMHALLTAVVANQLDVRRAPAAS